jgi:hypothetical protein
VELEEVEAMKAEAAAALATAQVRPSQGCMDAGSACAW